MFYKRIDFHLSVGDSWFGSDYGERWYPLSAKELPEMVRAASKLYDAKIFELCGEDVLPLSQKEFDFLYPEPIVGALALSIYAQALRS